MRKIRIGVMGCASIAERSMIPAIKMLNNFFELVGVASRNQEKAELLANKFGCESICGYDKLLERSDIEAIYMPLPTGLHKEWILKALHARKHVYAEKSIAMSYSDCLEFVKEAKKNNLILMEGYMFKFHSQHQQVLKLIDEGVIGEIRHFSASFGFPPLNASNFRYDPKIGGGALMDCAGYVLKASSFILRQKMSVKGAFTYFDARGVSLYGSAFLVGEKNNTASISYGFDNFYQCKYDLWGSKGKLTAVKAFTPKPKESPILILEKNEGLKSIVCEADNHFEKAMIAFANAIIYNKGEALYSEILEQSSLLDDLLKKSRF